MLRRHRKDPLAGKGLGKKDQNTYFEEVTLLVCHLEELFFALEQSSAIYSYCMVTVHRFVGCLYCTPESVLFILGKEC